MAGTVRHIYRHPIKSHGHEPMRSVRLEPGKTLPWDRRWAVRHEYAKTDGTDWADCMNFSRAAKAPSLMAIQAETDEDTGTVTLTHPDRPPLRFNPDRDLDAFLDWVKPLMPTGRAQSQGIVRVPDRGMTDSDYPSISIMNLASNKALSDRIGQQLDLRRWRGNIWLDGPEPWAEFNWVGKTLGIGDADVEIIEPIERCNATMANPDTGRRDAETLRALNDGWGHQDMGVLGIVRSAGTVRIGDEARLI